MRKKITKCFLIILMIGLTTAGAASAENSLAAGAKGLSFGLTDGNIEISGRFFTAADLAVLAGFGFSVGSNDETTTDYALSVGLRKYLSKADFTPFVGLMVSYQRNEFVVVSGGPGSNTRTESERTLSVDGDFGAEYFFSKQVSAEAQVGIGLSDVHNVNGTDVDESQFGTFSSGVTVNFYFP
jgi:hypothetical protein